jgi:uncharacterized OB-fold protein
MTTNESDLVAPKDACPGCGERDTDWLLRIDDDRVRCAKCGTVYAPPRPSREAPAR